MVRQHYANPPIAEATLEIRIQSDDPVPPQHLAEIRTDQEDAYPTQETVLLATGEWHLGPQLSASARQQMAGYRFKSAPGTRIITVRPDLFAFSQLAPYDRWELLRDEATAQWHRYRNLVHLNAITRIALRYINNIPIPLSNPEMSDYLRTYPEVAPDLPQGLSNYVMRLEVPNPVSGTHMILNQALLPQEGSDSVSVLLDIDLSRVLNELLDDASLWHSLEDLHIELDRTFEACITARAREEFR
jgi:uncharacterized protein (TIGR04255 family)